MEEKNSEKKERKMRDSGIPWIGEVPEGWKIPKLKYLAVLTNGDRGKNYPSGNDLVDEGVYFFTSNNLHSQILDCSREKSKFITEARYNILGGAKIRLNDILFCLRGSVGAAAINKTVESGTIASSLVCITPQNVDADFLNYCLQSNINVIQTNLFMNGSCAANLSAENVGNYYIIEPPISEQHRIADFLDSKCSEIDTLIENLRARVESAKEYKKAVITEAVTKGLNKDAKMKDSGVEWIGEIPEGWKVVRFKHIASIKSNLVQPDKYMKYPQIAPDNIEKDTGRLLSHQTVEESGVISGNHLFYRGQILYSKIRPNLNKLTIAPFDGLCSADMYPIEPKLPTLFMVYSMLSAYFVSQVSLIIQDRVKMPKINQEELGEIKVVVPSQQEMLTIADYLDSKCSEIDILLQNYENQITTLEEYKKSLIYEYVTGKKEVPAA